MMTEQSTPYRAVRTLPASGEVLRTLVRGPFGAAELWRVPPNAWDRYEPGVTAMAALDSAHVVALLDLAIDADGTVSVIREAVTGERALGALASPGWVSPGRAVTLLQPLAETLSAAHAAGVVLGAAGMLGVRITAEGRPLIDDLSQARAGAPLPDEIRSRDPDHRADIAALSAVRDRVAAALERAGFVSESRALPPTSVMLQNPYVMHGWSPPEPLTGHRATEQPAPTVVAPQVPADPPEPSGADVPAFLPRVLVRLGLTAEVTRPVSEAATAVRRWGDVLRRRARDASRRTLALGAAGAALVAGVVVSAMVTDSGFGVNSDPSADTVGPSVQTAAASEQNDRDATAETDPTQLHDPAEWQPVVDAVVVRWQRCRREGRALCDEALQSGSPVADRRAQGTDALADTFSAVGEDSAELVVLERAGDAVVLMVSTPDAEPASLLLMRGEAGWRVRDAWR